MHSSHKYSLHFIALLMLSTLLLGGCFGSGTDTTPEPEVKSDQLVGKTWRCTQLFEREVFGNTEITIEFMADGTTKGSGGCNSYTGTYTLAGKSLTFGPMIATEKSCGPSIDEQEFTFYSFLKQIEAVKIEDDELEMYTTEIAAPMVFTTGEGGGFLW